MPIVLREFLKDILSSKFAACCATWCLYTCSCRVYEMYMYMYMLKQCIALFLTLEVLLQHISWIKGMQLIT